MISRAPAVEPAAARHPYQTSFQSPHLHRRAGKALPEVSFLLDKYVLRRGYVPTEQIKSVASFIEKVAHLLRRAGKALAEVCFLLNKYVLRRGYAPTEQTVASLI